MLDDFREWLSDNLRYILLGLAVLLLLVIGFCVVKLIVGGGKSSGDGASAKPAVTETVKDDQEQDSTEKEAAPDMDAVVSAAVVNAGDLVKDDSAVLTIVKQYYTAVAEKNVDALAGIVSPWNDTVKENILSSDITESYSNISVYSQKGLEEGSYVVYAYYEGKVADMETLVPNLALLYLKKDATGKLVVSTDHDSDKAITDYITKASSNADVQNLISTVKQQYETVLESDPALRSYVASLVGDTGEEPATEAQPKNRLMTANYDVNIRATGSTDAAILGVVATGTDVTVMSEADADGWCQIHYESAAYGSIDGYVKMEFLSPSVNTADAAPATNE
ncbi:MAG: SH3 domain-containing protein [Lachnospiraceae bacterium]|nr:SH3 domain-containing protein [Lachnospiraceae bacterium]